MRCACRRDSPASPQHASVMQLGHLMGSAGVQVPEILLAVTEERRKEMQTAIGRIWHRWDAVEEFQIIFQIVFQIRVVSSWQMYSTVSMALSITNCIHSPHPVFSPVFGANPCGHYQCWAKNCRATRPTT